jgi:hypothetical protein
VKKNPESQKTVGLPCSIHFWKNVSLDFRSDTYDPNGLSDGYDLLIHNSGTLPLNSDLEAAYSDKFITIFPIIASFISLSDDRTILTRLLNLCSS